MSKNDSEIRRDAIIRAVTEMVSAQIETHFLEVTKAAEDSFVGDENQAEPIAKVKLAVEWSALAQAPKIAVRMSWSVNYKDEAETEIDPLQSKLGFDQVNPKVREIAEDIRNASPAVQRAAIHVVKALKESNSKKEGA